MFIKYFLPYIFVWILNLPKLIHKMLTLLRRKFLIVSKSIYDIKKLKNLYAYNKYMVFTTPVYSIYIRIYICTYTFYIYDIYQHRRSIIHINLTVSLTGFWSKSLDQSGKRRKLFFTSDSRGFFSLIELTIG